MLTSIITFVFGLVLVLLPEKLLANFIRPLLKGFGLSVETKNINLTKFVVNIIRYIGAFAIAAGIITYFVLPFYSITNS